MRKIRKQISILLIIGVLTPIFAISNYKPTYAGTETGIKNAMDDAISGELVALCNELGLDTVDYGGSWIPPRSPHWLQGMGIAIKKLQRWLFNKKEVDSHYNVRKTYASLFANPWPYDIQYVGGDGRTHPSVGDVCAALGISQVKEFGEYDAAYGDRKYNDVNFTEILAIMAQGEKGNWRTVNYHEFNEFIRRPEAQNLYYECDIEWIVVYKCEHQETDSNGEPITVEHYMDESYGHGKEGEGAAQGAPEEKFEGIHHWIKDHYWGKVKVKPMGLRNLYMLADAVPSDMNMDFYYHTNLELLNHQEDYTHTYLRDEADLNPVNYYDDRDKMSPIYEDLIDYYGYAKGRSAPYYIEKPYNLEDNPIAEEYTKMFQEYDLAAMKDWNIEWSGDITEAQQMILALAQSAIGKIGYVYGGSTGGIGWDAISKLSNSDDKGRTNGLDCSGFVQWVYRSALGVDLPRSCNGYKGYQSISKSELQPGMLGVMYGKATDARSGNHIGIYAGVDSSGKDVWIHCSGSGGGVVINNFGGFTTYYNPLGG